MEGTKGIIKTWKADRGFGFAYVDASDRAAFVHIRDVRPKGIEPHVGDRCTFEVRMTDRGLRAFGVELIDREADQAARQ